MHNFAEIRDGRRFCPNCGGSVAFDAALISCECGETVRCEECRCTKLTAEQVAAMDRRAGLFKKLNADLEAEE